MIEETVRNPDPLIICTDIMQLGSYLDWQKKQISDFYSLAETGHLLPEAEFAARSRLTCDELRRKVDTYWVFKVGYRADKTYYPSFFCEPQYNSQWCRLVCQTLGPLDGNLKYLFFRSPHPCLEQKTPLEVIKTASESTPYELQRIRDAAYQFVNAIEIF